MVVIYHALIIIFLVIFVCYLLFVFLVIFLLFILKKGCFTMVRQPFFVLTFLLFRVITHNTGGKIEHERCNLCPNTAFYGCIRAFFLCLKISCEFLRDFSKNNEGFAIYSLCESNTMLFAALLFVSIKQT